MQDFIFKYRRWWAACILLVCTVKIYYQTGRYLDVEFSDESYYMQCGLEMFGKLTLHWGPTYNLWYKLLSLCTNDPIQLYYVSFILMGALVPLLLYILLLRWRIPFFIALGISFCFMTSEEHVTTFARVSHFAVILMLTSLILSTFVRTPTKQIVLICTGVFMASYARPELTFGLILLLCWYAFRWWKSKQQAHISEKYVLLFFAVIVLANMLLSSWNSFELFGYKRDIIAFYDHYTLKMNMQKGNYDHWIYWEDVAEQDFGGKKHFAEVLWNYPKVVLRHMFYNVVLYVVLLAKWSANFVMPFSITEKWPVLRYIGMLLLLAISASVIYFPIPRKRMRALCRVHSENLLVLAIIGLPSLAACILIFPRFHYIYQQLPFYIFLLALLLQSLLPADRFSMSRLQFPIWIVLAFLMFAATPRIYQYDQFYIFKTYNERKPYSLCYKQLIPFLNNHQPDKKHVLFSNVFMSHIFLNQNYEVRNLLLDKRLGVRFDEFLEKEKVDVILLNHQIYTDSHLFNDSTWTYFIQHYEDFGFRKIRVSNDCDLEVLVK